MGHTNTYRRAGSCSGVDTTTGACTVWVTAIGAIGVGVTVRIHSHIGAGRGEGGKNGPRGPPRDRAGTGRDSASLVTTTPLDASCVATTENMDANRPKLRM